MSDMVREQVIKTQPHFAHVGIIEAARELSMQLDNLAEDDNDAQAAADLDSIHGHEGKKLNPVHWMHCIAVNCLLKFNTRR